MKTNLYLTFLRRWPAAGALAVVLLLSGCLEKRIIWSPDGSRAAVITKDGLYFCDAEGHLTSLRLPGVNAAAWLGDSQRLVVVRSREVKDWAAIAKVLGPERAATVETGAEAMWQQFQGGGIWSVLTADLKDRKEITEICLRERHAAELRAKLNAGEWDNLESVTVEVRDVAMARLEGDRVVIGAVVHEGLGTVWDLRPSPDGRAVAFTAEMKPESDELVLMVALVDGSGAAEIARHVSAYPDWMPDGRTLAYFESPNPGPAEDAVRLGALTQREVLDAAGKIKIAGKPRYLAGILFGGFSRVRCLSDGRILFNAAEIILPVAAEDYGDQREQLFALDPGRQSTLVRLIPRKHEPDLPKQLSFFEVSPDEQQVVFGSPKGEVCLLTLATGGFESIQTANKESPQGAPVWRKAGELTYVKRIEPKKEGPAAEVILRRGTSETVLSAGWPDDVVKRMTE